MFFANEVIPSIKKKEGISHQDAMKKAGQMWSDMSDKQK
jgi:hypothetical protein